MTKSLQFFILFTLASFIYTYPAPNPCQWTDPETQDKYDFTALSKPDGWKVVDVNLAKEGSLFNIDYFFSFCAPLESKCNGKGNLAVFEALEVMGQVTDACESLGSIDQMDVVAATSDGLSGVKIIFRGGETCIGSENPSQNGNPMSTTFNIICSEHADKEFHQIPFNKITNTKCTPEFFINHPAGCVGGVYRTNKGLLKLVIFIFIVYIVGGITYNMMFQNKQGLNAVPHIDFWKNFGENIRNFPTTIKNTAEAIVQKLKKGSTGGITQGILSGRSNSRPGKSAQYTLV